MARRDIGEINAGSMADIAFLLLVFFLVTTTLEKDEGLLRFLPPKLENPPPPVKIKEQNILRVSLNADDQLLVEKNSLSNVKEMEDFVRDFYDNPEPQTNTAFPKRTLVNDQVCAQNMQLYIQGDTSIPDNLNQWKSWKMKKEALPLLGGQYYELPSNAMIVLTVDNSTSYEAYIEVNNLIDRILNDLRNKYSQRTFGVKKLYTEMNEKTKKNPEHEDKAKVLAIRLVYPQRVSEAKPRNVGLD
jgi:biopolymer transport protein TolR